MADEKKAASDFDIRSSASLRPDIPVLDPDRALARIERGALIIDLREPHELIDGTAQGAVLIGQGVIDKAIREHAPDRDQELILMCAAGERSLATARHLREIGYRQVFNLRGGFHAWQQAGLPLDRPEVDRGTWHQRYARHLSLDRVGESGQQRLNQSRILIVGAGGLGSPAALYLAAAGVGHLRIVDADRVERSNLQRQILHSDHQLGRLKTESAVERLHALNPDIDVEPVSERLTEDNVGELIDSMDLVIDGSDNFPTRYLLNRACIQHRRPLIYGAVMQFIGQVAVFRAGEPGAPCYRCLFPEAPLPGEAPSCSEAGVLGVLPGVVGTLQATEAIKILLGIGQPLEARLLIYDALKADFRTMRLVQDPHCADCGMN